MERSEERLGAAVDEVLEPVWPAARRQAARGLVARAAARWAAGMGLVAAVAVGLRVLVGLTVPWACVAVVGALAALAAMPEHHELRHLRRGGDAGAPGGSAPGPSTFERSG